MRLVFFMHDLRWLSDGQQHSFADGDEFSIVLFDNVRMAGFAMCEDAPAFCCGFAFAIRHGFELAENHVSLLRFEFDGFHLCFR